MTAGERETYVVDVLDGTGGGDEDIGGSLDGIDRGEAVTRESLASGRRTPS